jgi:plasmid stabilization system protein ParE
MSGYKLAPPAQEDFAAIRDYYQREAGYRIARRMLAEFVEAFRLIAKTSAIGNVREDLAEKRPIWRRSTI